MPGYVNYYYKNSNVPGHTKLAFSEYIILAIQNLIALNALKECQYFDRMPIF